MKEVVHSFIAALTVFSTSVWALPHPGAAETTGSVASGGRSAARAAASSTEITSLTGTLTTGPTPTAPPPEPVSSSFTGRCDYSFCNTDGNNVCFYWAGYTSWDVSRGPIPGEVPTVLGPCTDGL
ncbi:hypothetical protein F5Y04DRAFT_36082 [Hypomontagnella monticulosa]|nr:hypothetical protein F5Y04DRAFT_36082 [Hypomontagnella monticulosa]